MGLSFYFLLIKFKSLSSTTYSSSNILITLIDTFHSIKKVKFKFVSYPSPLLFYSWKNYSLIYELNTWLITWMYNEILLANPVPYVIIICPNPNMSLHLHKYSDPSHNLLPGLLQILPNCLPCFHHCPSSVYFQHRS